MDTRTVGQLDPLAMLVAAALADIVHLVETKIDPLMHLEMLAVVALVDTLHLEAYTHASPDLLVGPPPHEVVACKEADNTPWIDNIAVLLAVASLEIADIPPIQGEPPNPSGGPNLLDRTQLVDANSIDSLQRTADLLNTPQEGVGPRLAHN